MSNEFTFPSAIETLEIYQEKLPAELDDRLGKDILPAFAQRLNELTISPAEVADTIFKIATEHTRKKDRVNAAAVFLANAKILVELLTDDSDYTTETVDYITEVINHARQDFPGPDKKVLGRITDQNSWRRQDKPTNTTYRIPNLSQRRLSALAKGLERRPPE